MEWTVKDTSLGGEPAEPVKVEVMQTERAQFTLRATYLPIAEQGEIQRIAGIRTQTHQRHIQILESAATIIAPRTIEFPVIVDGFALDYMIDAAVLATRDPRQVHFGRLPLTVTEVPLEQPVMPPDTIIVGADLTAPPMHLMPGNVSVGIRWRRLYEEEPARSFSVGRASADPDRQIDEALEPADRRFPDTATIEGYTVLDDGTGVIIQLANLRENCNYNLVVGYKDANGRTQQSVLGLSTKEPL